MIALIDYFAGNVRSIENAFEKLGAKVKLTKDPKDLKAADAIILPGVGNFGDAMSGLEKYESALRQEVDSGKPFLGLCLGIQVILESSEEAPGAEGLGILEGTCERFPDTVKVPHMGWNTIEVKRDNPLFEGIESGAHFYFVHSYYPKPKDDKAVAATTEYGIEFPSVIAKDNIMATQFHPEKSGEAGLAMLSNYLKLIKK